MSETDAYWLKEANTEMMTKYGDFDQMKNGKWMLFYGNGAMDEMWKRSVQFYREDKLTGISELQSITLIPDSVIPEFAHTGPRISVPHRNR